MDRNSVIGITLIAILLFLYFNYFSPPPSRDTTTDKKITALPRQDTVVNTSVYDLAQPEPKDSLLKTRKGLFSFMAMEPEKEVKVTNQDLEITFSNQGGILKEVRLKHFESYGEQPLYLIKNGSSSFSLRTPYEGQDIDLYQLHYAVSKHQNKDSTTVEFTLETEEGILLKQVYSIPPSGYKIGYRIESKGLPLADNLLAFQWVNRLRLQEQHIEESRRKATINYYTASGDFDGLSEVSLEKEEEVLVNPLTWVALKQKFFVSALITKHIFKGGEVSTVVDAADSTTVKIARAKLFVPGKNIADGSAQFHYFFGPSKYSVLSKATNGFSKNLTLGWPPIIWVNKFLIIPIFKFLEGFIDNYGIIIIILVFMIKLILSPLSYKSYLGMAKMKLLKPDLDIIKEKHEGDMAAAQQEQLKLYQQAGVNPFSGCIPLVLQMPILFAMFYFFPVSIELRQSGFLWAEDLSTYDSVLSLPFTIPFYGDHVSLFVLLMTLSTLVYTWQNNQISSAQGPMKSVSYFMPIIFMFVLNSYSAGLSFYYFVSNIVTFAQQALIRKFVDENKIKAVMEEHRKKTLTGKGKQSRFMVKLQGAMKMSEEKRKKDKKP